MMDEQLWERTKRAAQEYAQYRPKRVQAAITITPDDHNITVPENTFGVAFTTYGEQLTLQEFVQAGEADQGYYFDGATLQFTKPAESIAVVVVWEQYYLPDELNQTFEGLPERDKPLVEMLAAEDTTGNSSGGVVRYSIGATQIQYGEGGASVSGSALRQRALAILRQPVAVSA